MPPRPRSHNAKLAGQSLPARSFALVLCLGLFAGLASCVTERVPVQASPYVNVPAGGTGPTGGGVDATAGSGGGVLRSSSGSRIRLGLVPLGAVPHDGLTLPLVSTDARYIAAQDGPHPSWDSLLPVFAKPESPARTPTIRAFAISGWPAPANADAGAAPPAPSLRELGPVSLPNGVILGRSADHRGFLVERPRNDGGRAIGFVPWNTLKVEWVVDDPRAGSGATLLAEAPGSQRRRIAWSRLTEPRKPADPVTDPPGLVLEVTDSTAAPVTLRLSPASASAIFPLSTSDPNLLFAVTLPATPSGRLGLAAFSLAEAPKMLGHALLDEEATALGAFQMVASLQTPWPASLVAQSAAPQSGVPVFLPGAMRTAWIGTDGTVSPLLRSSVVGVPLNQGEFGSAGALAVATDRQVAVLVPRVIEVPQRPSSSSPASTSPWSSATESRLVSGAYLPRAFVQGDRSGLILVEYVQTEAGTSEMRVFLCDLTSLPKAEIGR